MTGRTITQIMQRTKVEIIVADSAVNQIVGDIINNLSHGKEDARGMIFIKDVSDAYEIGTKRREAVLSHK